MDGLLNIGYDSFMGIEIGGDIKQVDEENSIEQVSSIENDVVTFTDGESVQGTWK